MKLTQDQIDRVRSLEDASGCITPDQVVADAKNKRSPLHALFEWNQAKAAAAHWLDQARDIIQSVKIVVENQTVNLRVPAYQRDPDAEREGKQGYRSVVALRNDPARARESLIATLEIAAGHIRRAQDLAVALGLAAEIDALLERVVGVQQAIKKAA